MATLPVKYYDCLDTGAPLLGSATLGSLIAVLDACLVDGYNTQTIQSITLVGSTATVSYATAHGYRTTQPQVVAISGCDQAEYNGEFSIFNVTSTTYQITVVGTPASPATGTSKISKVAPLGWSKVFSGTNKAVYKSNWGVLPTQYLRVDDSLASFTNGTTNYAQVRGYETMTDVNTGTAPFPTLGQAPNFTIGKGAYATGTPNKPWRIFGDPAFFYFIGPGSTTSETYTQFSWATSSPSVMTNVFSPQAFYFGNIISYKAGDAYSTTIGAYYNPSPTTTSGNLLTASESSTDNYICRRHYQDGGSTLMTRRSTFGKVGHDSGGSNSQVQQSYPSPVSNSLVLGGPWLAMYGNDSHGLYPGAYWVAHHMTNGTTAMAYAADKRTVSDVPGFPGRTFVLSQASSGFVAFDITGPWR